MPVSDDMYVGENQEIKTLNQIKECVILRALDKNGRG